ncbi:MULTISPECIES: hypothetical protein [Lactococcus]|uniref:hypothetical protein n=1 Tax=Lactococcus TaxID=1357 RepID=UPI001CDC5FD1|nr:MULTISPECIES: hypothetical protein [Lactococcus]MCA2390343.1 hypothetical protein [Lactococcus sp. NH2-7C]MCT1193148.1 hypothetical protein [Lactococcus lactis]WGV29409.1 hypothetical protein QJV49_07640 [Lactococcus sp. NH2-7C]
MKTKQYTLILATMSTLFLLTVAVRADEVSPAINVTSSGDVNLVIPNDADKVITSKDNQVKYQVNDGVSIDNAVDGTDLTAPIIVDSQIISENRNSTSGVTTISADLSQAKVKNSKKVSLNSIGMNKLWETEVFAGTIPQVTTPKPVYDVTLGIKVSLKLKWTIVQKGTQATATLNNVSGGYSGDSQILVDSSHKIWVNAGEQDRGGSVYSQKFYPGSSRSFSYNLSLKTIPYAGGTGGSANYLAHLKRGTKSAWDVKIQAFAWGGITHDDW